MQFSNTDIEAALSRSARAMRKRNGFVQNRTEGTGVRFAAAALRRETDPNNAEGHGLLRDSNVPHADGFMEWAELEGTRLYADYEFLYGRHSGYFKDQEHARAAVELVLSEPERVQDLNGNRSFVGFDEETGGIYRIEIEPKAKQKFNHVRSVFKITPEQYNKIKLDSSPVLQPSPTEHNAAGRTLSSFLRYDSTGKPDVKPDSENNIKFSVAPPVDSAAFRKWFGDSKVVDADGNPLVVYRRDDEKFTVFDINETQKTNAGWLGKGFYFYGDKREAESAYAYGKHLRSFYLAAENPYFISEEEYDELVNADDPVKSAEFTERLKAEGYDSVYWNGDLRQEWIVFSPGQIKSATDNVGTYDRNNPDIRFSVGEDAEFYRSGAKGEIAGAQLVNHAVAEKALRNFGDTLYNATLNINAVISGRERKELLGEHGKARARAKFKDIPDADYFAIIANIDRLFANAIKDGELHPGRKAKDAFDIQNTMAGASVNNTAYLIGMKIKVAKTEAGSPPNAKNKLYYVEVADIKKAAHSKTTENSGNSASLVLPENNILDKWELVKNNIVDLGIFTDKTTRSGEFAFSLAEYSEADQRDIVAILKPYAGMNVEHTAEEFAAYLAEKGVNIPAKDAWTFALEASRENLADARKRGVKQRNQWLYETFPYYRMAVDMGGENFVIKPSHKYLSEEFSGSFIHPDIVKYSRQRPQGKKENDASYRRYLAKRKKALASADGIDTNEMAKAIARETGEDESELEQRIVDFFRDLKKKDFYREYTKWKNEQFFASKEANRKAQEEWLKQEKFRIQDEVVSLLESGQGIDAVYVAEHPDVYRELYRQLFGKEAPAAPSKKDMEAINAALLQEGSNASIYARAYKAAREKLWQEHLENEKKKKEKEALAAFYKRIDQLRPAVNRSRMVIGTRDDKSQSTLNYVIEITEMHREELENRRDILLDELDELNRNGDDTTQTEEKLHLVSTFGGLPFRSAEDVAQARAELELIAAEGRSKIRAIAERRRANDRKLTEMLISRITSGKGIKEAQDAWDAHWQDREDVNASKKSYIYSILKLEDFLYLLSTNGERGDWLENPAGKLFQRVHSAAMTEQYRKEKYARFRDDMLDKVLGSKNSIQRAARLQKLRTRTENTGIFRNPASARKITYHYITLDRAREILNSYDSTGNLPDATEEYQLEVLRSFLKARDMKMQRSYKPDEMDGLTEQVFEAMKKEEAGAVNNTGEEMVGIPLVSFPHSQAYEIRNLNQLEALFLQLMWDQKDIRAKMIMNGYSNSTAEQLGKFLLPETKALAEPMRKYLEKLGDEAAGAVKRTFFADMVRTENYFPSVYNSRRVVAADKAPGVDDPNASYKAETLSPGSLKVRSAHLMEPKISDALVVFENHVRRMSRYVAWADTARELRGTLLQGDLREAANQVFGSGFFSEFQSAVMDTVNGGDADAKYSAFFQSLFSNAVSVKMIFNLVTGLKQTLGSIAYANDVPLGALLRSAGQVWRHPQGIFAELRKSQYLQSRFHAGADLWQKMANDSRNRYVSSQRLIGKMLKTQNNNIAAKLAAISQTLQALKYWGGLPTRLGDAFPVLIIGAGVYKYHFDKMKAQGFSTGEAAARARRRWEIATESLQQSGAVHNQNAWQRGGNFGKMFTAWKSNQILQGQRALREAIASRIFGPRHAGKDRGMYSSYLDSRIKSGKLHVTASERKILENFYQNFPLGETVTSRWGEHVVFAPPMDGSYNPEVIENYIHHFAVKRNQQGLEDFSQNHIQLFSKLAESLRNPDERFLTVTPDGSPRVCYLKKIESRNGNHFMVCAIDQDGIIREWTHMDAKDSYIEKQRNNEERAIRVLGLTDKDGQRVDMNYEDYLAEKSDIPLYLATAELNQDRSPQMDVPDHDINIAQKSIFSNEIRFRSVLCWQGRGYLVTFCSTRGSNQTKNG